MKRFTITLITVLLYSTALPCGFDWSEYHEYFSVYNQKNISNENFYPFLRTKSSRFYSSPSPSISGNKKLWQEIIPNKELKTVYEIVYGKKLDKLEESLALKPEITHYLEFAYDCQDRFNILGERSWDYNQILEKTAPEANDLLEYGLPLFHATKNRQLKLRYAYQIIRIFHYTNRDNEGIKFFENQVENQFAENEIYYYTIDQVAGCYYSMDNFEKAAYLYLQVFTHSQDRKGSAMLSYGFCENTGASGNQYISTKEDSIDLIAMRSLRSFSDELNGIEKIKELDPNDDRIEVLFARAINNVEREVLPKRIGTDPTALPTLKDANFSRIAEMRRVASEAIENDAISNKDYWQISMSYLQFLDGDLKAAQKSLKKVEADTEILLNQVQVLSDTYKVFSWKKMDREKEDFVGDIINSEVSTEFGHGIYSLLRPDWKFLIIDRIAHLYYKDGELAKAFLMHNGPKELGKLSSIELIDALINFTEKNKESELEKSLEMRVSSSGVSRDDLYYARGIYYLQNRNPKKAKEIFDKISSANRFDNRRSPFREVFSNRIFSNNLKECFSCPEGEVMTDSVYQLESFDFIKGGFSEKELANYLIELESLATNASFEDQHLANYLLGNFYFNISNTGYYRGELFGSDAPRSHTYYFGYSEKEEDAQSIIESNSGFNLYGIRQHYKLFHNFSTTATSYYNKALDLSTNPEFEAKCLYAMAKCELNQLYNGPYKDEVTGSYASYAGEINGTTGSYKTSFEKLKQYENTEFYDMIIDECNFFEYYVSRK